MSITVEKHPELGGKHSLTEYHGKFKCNYSRQGTYLPQLVYHMRRWVGHDEYGYVRRAGDCSESEGKIMEEGNRYIVCIDDYFALLLLYNSLNNHYYYWHP